jgi:hypothetical protein
MIMPFINHMTFQFPTIATVLFIYISEALYIPTWKNYLYQHKHNQNDKISSHFGQQNYFQLFINKHTWT